MRSLPPLKLARSPLVLVLAQIKISPILQMSEFVPSIQEKLRHQGFPMFRAKRTQEILLGPKTIFESRDRWLFSNKEMTRTAVLAPDFLVLMASVYSVFEEFADSLKTLLEIVGAETKAALSDRLGLRYVDLVRVAEGEAFDEYFHPGLHGIPPAVLGAKHTQQQVQIRAETEMGSLFVRLWQNTEGTLLPPDLQVDDVTFRDLPKAGELVTILDLDHFSITQRDFVPDRLVDDMWKLHDGSDRAFRAVVTPTALNRWGAESA